jgi:hypothetical protein
VNKKILIKEKKNPAILRNCIPIVSPYSDFEEKQKFSVKPKWHVGILFDGNSSTVGTVRYHLHYITQREK